MSTFDDLTLTIAQHTPEVLRRFETFTEEAPWIDLPEEYRVNFLGELIGLCADLALRRPDDVRLCFDMLHGAAHHGEDRLARGFPDMTIFQELYLVRDALWTDMKRWRDEYGSMVVAEAILRVDMALTLASKASLRGYYRSTFEARGAWPTVIDQLADEWTPPPPMSQLAQELARLDGRPPS